MITPGRGGRVKEGGAWLVARGRGSPASAPARPGATLGRLGRGRRLRWPRRQGGRERLPERRHRGRVLGRSTGQRAVLVVAELAQIDCLGESPVEEGRAARRRGRERGPFGGAPPAARPPRPLQRPLHAGAAGQGRQHLRRRGQEDLGRGLPLAPVARPLFCVCDGHDKKARWLVSVHDEIGKPCQPHPTRPVSVRGPAVRRLRNSSQCRLDLVGEPCRYAWIPFRVPRRSLLGFRKCGWQDLNELHDGRLQPPGCGAGLPARGPA
ncbi:uncharacterized protein SOCE26_091190 [Sorangium cellulosum]|uniref:Uncharacterized protein n=1 Tax=Sorangium cellulosum TaxID=56 RepID=A0A2L0F7U9_SORCE|nr:uncharacterized protein SOCE26_091190 [Sorangium cellulosum]